MDLYETIIIIKSDLSDYDKKDIKATCVRWLKEASGKRAVKVDDWGVKNLVYPISGHTSGHYISFTHYASEEGTKEFHKLLDSMHDHAVLKYTSIRQSEEDKFNFDETDEFNEQQAVDALDVALGLAKY